MQEMIALYRLDMVWQQKQKEEPKKSPGHTRRRVKQQKHHAETRDPPSQDPRDHMAQADSVKKRRAQICGQIQRFIKIPTELRRQTRTSTTHTKHKRRA